MIGIQRFSRTNQPFDIVVLGTDLGGIEDRIAPIRIEPTVRLVGDPGIREYDTTLQCERIEVEYTFLGQSKTVSRGRIVHQRIEQRDWADNTKHLENMSPVQVRH